MDIKDGLEECATRRLIHDKVVVFSLTVTGGLLGGCFEVRPELAEVHISLGWLSARESVDEGDLIEGVVGSTCGEFEVNGNVIDAYIVPMTVLGDFCGEVGWKGGF